MANEVIPTSIFINKVKRLKRKFHTLEGNLLKLEEALIANPWMGDAYGKNIYKVRIADESKGKGKSGGFRVVTYVIDETKESASIYLITIFDKSEEDTIDKIQVLKLVKKCGLL